MKRLLLATLISLALLPAARAGLFDDEEARKAIVELRNRVDKLEEAKRTRDADQNEQIAALRRSVLELNNQLEAMRAEAAKTRGENEQLLREVAEMQRRQRDVDQAFQDRLRTFEPVKVNLDGRELSVKPDEKKAFDEAFAAVRGGNFDQAVALFSNFQRRYPGSQYNDAVRFWLGNAQYGRRQYREAIDLFRSFVAESPSHPRAPEAMLALANSQAEMKDSRSARRTIEDLMKTYPQSEAAAAGKDRLATLR